MNEFYKNKYAGKGAHLGNVYPFISEESSSNFFFNMDSMIDFRKENNLGIQLDQIALVEKSCLPYILGDRTLLKGVKRAPWMHSFKDSVWVNEELPDHGMAIPNRDSFTLMLKAALLREAADYIGEHKSVGILLSGGMDSRIVAGILRELQNNNNLNVVGITWGSSNSRDVVYSQRICQQFGWEFVHCPITAETLSNNIRLSAKMGAEVSPLHYHAMAEVAGLKGVDVILAGSYGDSVGRAEFSGKHLTKLSSILPSKVNRLGLIKDGLFKDVQKSIIDDAKLPDFYHVGKNNLRKYEIEQECHYMRRMLQSCMHVVAEKIPFHQMFTAPTVFGLMWSLTPTYRDNEWYSKLLSILPGNLLYIPWARTGKLYNLPTGAPDHFDKRYHQYGSWLRTELKDDMLSYLNSSNLRDIGIYNDHSLDALASNWKRVNKVSNNMLDETVSWLASLSVFMSNNQLSISANNYSYTSIDYYNAAKGTCYGALYSLARNYLKNS